MIKLRNAYEVCRKESHGARSDRWQNGISMHITERWGGSTVKVKRHVVSVHTMKERRGVDRGISPLILNLSTR
jgi:hypothetical protein